MRVKQHLKKIPGLASIVRWLGLSAPSDWLYTRTVLDGVSDRKVRRQLPWLYRFFVFYCDLYGQTIPLERIYGAKYLFNLISNLQRLYNVQHCTRITVADLDVCLDLHDPRFLEVINALQLAEHSDTRILPSLLEPGDTFIDVGANQGSFSLVAAPLVGDTGQIVAIEPQLRLAENLEKSLHKNAPGPFEVHRIAVGDHNGTIELLVPRNYSGTAGVYRDHSGLHRHSRLDVPIRRFDDVVAWETFPGSAVVKLDIEGSEFAFLEGAREMLGSLRPDLLLEVNPGPLHAAGTHVDDLVALLKQLGYEFYRHTDDLTTFHSLESLEVVGHENIVVSPPKR